jgi:hypothetical protein
VVVRSLESGIMTSSPWYLSGADYVPEDTECEM